MAETSEKRITRNYLDTPSYWREYPDRDVEFVRWYPCDVDYLTADQVFARPKPAGRGGATFYAHIPFCNYLCTSCPYNKFNTRNAIVDRFVAAMQKEIDTYARLPYFRDTELLSGYFGGGTPTTLRPEQLDLLLGRMHERFNVKKGCSITVESTPVDIDPAKIAVMLRHGVDRVSMGVQTFYDPQLRHLGRSPQHTGQRSIDAVHMLMREGIENVCIDLMIGIPGQDMQSWERDLDTLMSLPINSFSIYLYLVLPGSEAFFRIQSGQMPPCPTTEEQDTMYWRLVDKVLSNNYVAVTSNDFGGPLTGEWTRMGVRTWPIAEKNGVLYKGLDTKSFYLTDHLLHSWYECGDMLSLGSGAYGYLNDHMYLNEPDILRYVERCENGELPITMGAHTDPQERMARSLVLGLKLLRVERSDFRRAHGVDLYEVFKERIDLLVARGLLELTDEVLQVTFPKGWFYIDNISKTFYSERNYRLPQPSPQSTDFLRWRKRRVTAAAAPAQPVLA